MFCFVFLLLLFNCVVIYVDIVVDLSIDVVQETVVVGGKTICACAFIFPLTCRLYFHYSLFLCFVCIRCILSTFESCEGCYEQSSPLKTADQGQEQISRCSIAAVRRTWDQRRRHVDDVDVTDYWCVCLVVASAVQAGQSFCFIIDPHFYN